MKLDRRTLVVGGLLSIAALAFFQSDIKRLISNSLNTNSNHASDSATIEMKTTVGAELDIYSGRPNPTWMLLSTEALQLKNAISHLTGAVSKPQPEQLGYRGLIVKLDNGEVLKVFDGHVWKVSDGKTTHFLDHERSLERWLLKTTGAVSIDNTARSFALESFSH